MPLTDASHRIENVRGRLDEARAQQVRSFLTEGGGSAGAAERDWLTELVCVLLDGSDGVVGISSVHEDSVPIIGDRTFWIYRAILSPEAAAEDAHALIEATHRALNVEFKEGRSEAPGMCCFVSDPAMLVRHPQAVWPGTGMIYAGYLEDGSQVRIGYFEGARI